MINRVMGTRVRDLWIHATQEHSFADKRCTTQTAITKLTWTLRVKSYLHWNQCQNSHWLQWGQDSIHPRKLIGRHHIPVYLPGSCKSKIFILRTYRESTKTHSHTVYGPGLLFSPSQLCVCVCVILAWTEKCGIFIWTRPVHANRVEKSLHYCRKPP